MILDNFCNLREFTITGRALQYVRNSGFCGIVFLLIHEIAMNGIMINELCLFVKVDELIILLKISGSEYVKVVSVLM